MRMRTCTMTSTDVIVVTFALRKTCCPMGKPSVCLGEGREKRKRRVSCESSIFSSRRTGTFLRGSKAFGRFFISFSVFCIVVIHDLVRKSSLVKRGALTPWFLLFQSQSQFPVEYCQHANEKQQRRTSISNSASQYESSRAPFRIRAQPRTISPIKLEHDVHVCDAI